MKGIATLVSLFVVLIAVGFWLGFSQAKPITDVQLMKDSRWAHFEMQMRTPLERELFWSVKERVKSCRPTSASLPVHTTSRRLALLERIEYAERLCVQQWMAEGKSRFQGLSPEMTDLLKKLSLYPSTAENLP